MIRDFEFCMKLIEQQIQQNLNQEYLFFIKVRNVFTAEWTALS